MTAIAGIELEVQRRGAGPPLLYLHGPQPLSPRSPFLDRLAERRNVVAPSHPGFGNSPRPAWFETVYDLVQLYRALLDQLGPKVTLVGHSFGGWLAAELAAAGHPHIDRLVLVDAFGIKLGDRETADILDLFNTAPDEVRRRSWHDPRHAPDFDAMEDAEITAYARGWDALCLYGWHPYMYNPQLKAWLRRIAVPSLVLWGAADGVVDPAYGRGYAEQIPGARFELIERAAHWPPAEQPEATAAAILRFLGEA